ncbi:MAG: hypothetical protein KC419_08830 [Anaerolineales bacterium]|nr:hypothetical protein [Anaerolineales bacterium]
MATTPILNSNSSTGTLGQEDNRHAAYRKIGLLNGLFIGLGIALGSWGISTVTLSRLPVLMPYPSLIAAALLVVALCALTGRLTVQIQRTWSTLLLWLGTAVLVILVISYQPTILRTWMVWLADRRFWGLPIYPQAEADFYVYLLAGFFILLLLVVLGLLETFRLEGVLRELGQNGRFLPRSWTLLLLPVPFAFAAGFLTIQFIGDTTAAAVSLVHQAIEGSRGYEGDLFQLGLKDGINYSAFRGVQDRMTPTYTLAIGGEDAAMSSTFVTITFDNELWVSCRVISGQLTFCADASPIYFIGLTSLITGEPIPEQCLNCLPTVDEQLAQWLAARRSQFNGPPQISRLAQWGSYVLVEAASQSGSYKMTCWFSGVSPVQLDSCTE